jgi:copper transport protein
VAAFCVLAALPATASAHARLLSSVPAQNARITIAPRVATFRFDNKVAVGPDNAVVDNHGDSLLAGVPHTSGRVLTVPLKPLTRGAYTVRWSVVSDDGHTIDGVVAFGFGGEGETPNPTLKAGGSGPSAIDVIARWLLIAGTLVGAGAAFFLVAIRRGASNDIRVTLLVGAGFVAAAVGSAIERGRVPGSTRFAHATEVACFAAVIGVVLAATTLRRPGLQRSLLAPALVLVLAPPFGGHALDAGVPRIEVLFDAAHVGAAAVWVGGLAAVALGERGEPVIARRFSRVALAAVSVVAVTGVLRALSELTSFGQLLSTGYGRAIVIKTALFAVLLALGYLARSRFLGRPGALRRLVRGDLALLAGLVIAVAFLTSLPPGRSLGSVAAAPASGPPPFPSDGELTLARQLGDRGVTIAVHHEQGRLAVTTTLFGQQGDGVDGLDVRIAGRPAQACGSGCYRAVVPATPLLPVRVGTASLTFRLPATLKGGSSLLQRIGARYMTQTSSAFHERLASGTNQFAESNWRLQAPNKLAYSESNGAAGIVIGGRRWDRQGGGRWVGSSQSPQIPQLQLPWTRSPLDTFMLPPARIGGRPVVRVAFVDPATPAWFTVTADARTLELQQVDMVAPAHFMRDTYRAGPARAILPPG